jgi:cytochrome P450
VIGHKPSIEPDDLLLLKYTENVLYETLRMCPPTNILVRELGEDIRLDNLKIPKGTWLQVIINFLFLKFFILYF